MTTTQNPAAGALFISEEHADRLENSFYSIQELSLAMQAIIGSDIDPILVVVALAAVRKDLHRVLDDCRLTLEEVGVLGSYPTKAGALL